MRFSYCRRSSTCRRICRATDQYQSAGVRGFEETARPGVGGSFPDFSWSGYTAMNGSAFDQRPKTQDLKVWEVTDNVTWITGRHILKFGGKFRRWVPLFTDSKQYAGQWSFDGSITAEPGEPGRHRRRLRRFPARLSAAGDAGISRRHVRRPGQLLARLRAGRLQGLQPPDAERRPALRVFAVAVRLSAARSAPSSPARRGRSSSRARATCPISPRSSPGPSAYALFQNSIQTSSQAGLPLSITKTDRTQFGPRFGFAWQPFGERTVVRGGYGLFYEQESSADRVNNNMVPFRLDQTSFNDQSPPVRTMADFFLGTKLTNSAAPSIGASALEQKMGRDHHFSLGVQQEIAPFTVLEVNYVGNIGRFLNGTTNINIPEPASGGIQARRPYPQFGGINYFDDSLETTYHSLQTSVEQRTHAGLFYLASYTWSKSFTTQNVPAVGGNTGREKALSGFDVPHNVALSAGYELPFGRGRRLLQNANAVAEAVLGGWQVQGIYIWRSGRPFTPTISSDRANTGVGGQRPNRARIGRARRSDRRGVVRQDGLRPAGAIHLWQFRRQHPARRQLQDARLLAVQAVPHRRAPAAVPRRGVQRDQHAELQRAQHRHRYGGGRAGHQHVEHAAPDAVRAEVRVLTEFAGHDHACTGSAITGVKCDAQRRTGHDEGSSGRPRRRRGRSQASAASSGWQWPA